MEMCSNADDVLAALVNDSNTAELNLIVLRKSIDMLFLVISQYCFIIICGYYS